MSLPGVEYLGTFDHESPEWHATRLRALGGSEIAAVLGLSKWESRYSLWLRKKGIIAPQKVNKAMTVGTYVEPSILAWWEDQHPDMFPQRTGTFRSIERPWMLANPDNIYAREDDGTHVLVECKFVVWDHEWGAEGTDEIPPYYLTQCRWYMDVFGIDACYVAVLFGGCGEFREYVVRQDAADVELMRREGLAFIESLTANERPSIDEHDVTYVALREENPAVGAGDIEVSGEVRDQFVTARRALAVAQTHAQHATNRVLGLLNDCEARRATHGGTVLAYKKAGRNGAPAYLQASPLPKEPA
jgi:putative phage-type endonuclease